MKRLIVNADDFGYTRGVNSGIIRCFREGIVTSTTIMANAPGFEDAVAQAKCNPKLGVGCHLVLLDGFAVEPPKSIPSLADAEGRLPGTLAVLMGKIMMRMIHAQDVANEIRAQIAKVIGAGITPTHLDTHKHAHSNPWIFEQVLRVAEEFGIRRVRKPFEDPSTLRKFAFSDGWGSMRQSASALIARAALPRFDEMVEARGMLTPDRFWGVAATGRLNRAVVLAAIRSMKDEANELMCHPGEYDADLEHSATRLKNARETEMEALTDPAVRESIQNQNIALIDYRGLS